MNKTRLDRFLTRQHPRYSRTQIKKLIDGGFVLVDGEKKRPSFLLHGGETIEMVRRAPEIPKAEAEPIPLNILYEDDDLLVINKEAGMVVHPAPGNARGTLVNAVLHHLNIPTRTLPLHKGRAGEGIRPGIVHRLDKGTSGVMVIAKNEKAQKHLSNQFKNREVEKFYVALVFGKFPQKSGTISRPIGRDSLHRRKFSSKTRKAREAVTHYTVRKQYEGFALLEIRPVTGRTHQIRVHLSEFHHPIVGDIFYGAKSRISSIKDDFLRGRVTAPGRPLLHARELKLTHPGTKERMDFKASLPNDFQDLLNCL